MLVPDPIVGQSIIWIDEHRREIPALVKYVWQNGKDFPAGVNLVFISQDETRTDSAGRQTEIKTSVPHISVQVAGGYAWKHIAE